MTAMTAMTARWSAKLIAMGTTTRLGDPPWARAKARFHRRPGDRSAASARGRGILCPSPARARTPAPAGVSRSGARKGQPERATHRGETRAALTQTALDPVPAAWIPIQPFPRPGEAMPSLPQQALAPSQSVQGGQMQPGAEPNPPPRISTIVDTRTPSIRQKPRQSIDRSIDHGR